MAIADSGNSRAGADGACGDCGGDDHDRHADEKDAPRRGHVGVSLRTLLSHFTVPSLGPSNAMFLISGHATGPGLRPVSAALPDATCNFFKKLLFRKRDNIKLIK